jgi:tRNA (cytidine/uridine-2'-O-)-methyltransferase
MGYCAYSIEELNSIDKIESYKYMFDIVLFQPEIPPNTGNVIRLCANTGARLHLVKPLGFPLDDAKMRRAGLDYHEFADLKVHEDWQTCREHLTGRRIFALTTKGSQRYTNIQFKKNDVFIFGPETRGLPIEILAEFDTDSRLRLPMMPVSRSLNLSNTVAIVLFEAWRQIEFAGGI